jgi:hypothetical protein
MGTEKVYRRLKAQGLSLKAVHVELRILVPHSSACAALSPKP